MDFSLYYRAVITIIVFLVAIKDVLLDKLFPAMERGLDYRLAYAVLIFLTFILFLIMGILWFPVLFGVPDVFTTL